MPSGIAIIALLLTTAPPATAAPTPTCHPGESGRLIRYEGVASYPTATSVGEYFDEWIAFYEDFYQVPPSVPETFKYGFDSYKVTYCTTDALLPGQARPQPTVATGLVSVPRKSGPLATVAYVRGTAVSFYDTPSNPNIVGAF